MRSWIKPSPFEGTASKFLFDTIKSIQRRISAPKIIHPAEVNCDNELPDQSCKHFFIFTFLPLIHWCHKSPNMQRLEDKQKNRYKILLCFIENCFSVSTAAKFNPKKTGSFLKLFSREVAFMQQVCSATWNLHSCTGLCSLWTWKLQKCTTLTGSLTVNSQAVCTFAQL